MHLEPSVVLIEVLFIAFLFGFEAFEPGLNDGMEIRGQIQWGGVLRSTGDLSV